VIIFVQNSEADQREQISENPSRIFKNRIPNGTVFCNLYSSGFFTVVL